MGTVTIRNNKEMDLVNSYMGSLVHLTDRMKVELINRLSASLLSEKKGDTPSVGLEVFSEFQGSWGGAITLK